MKSLRADIIAVGSELLLGGRLDSNSVFVAHLLAECGIEVRKKISVGDQKGDIQEALRGSLKRAHVIVLTGGLGSTLDDCTREAVATTLQCPLIKRKKAYDNLKASLSTLWKTGHTAIGQAGFSSFPSHDVGEYRRHGARFFDA